MRPKPPPKYRIIIMMATNMPGALDEALLRPGRIDRIYKVGYPKKEGRKRTFEGYLDKINHELTDEQIERLAIISPYATGASIKDMVNEALVQAIRDGRESVTWLDVLKAKALKTYGMPDGMDYVQRERHNIALHEACHAVAMYRLKSHTTIDVATIEGRNGNGGFVNEIPLEERFVDWRSEVENDVMTFLASLVGERMFYEGDNTQGVGGDMGAATRLVTTSISRHAMGTTLSSREVTVGSIGPVNFKIEDGADRLVMDGPFGQAVEAKLRELYERTVSLLEENRHEVLALTHALEVHKTISGEDVAAILEATEGPTVDGRMYWQSGVPQVLEDYHRAALVAHQTNSPIDRELPVIEVGAIDVSGGASRRSRRLRLGADEPEGDGEAAAAVATAARPRRRTRAVPLNGNGNGNGKTPARRARTPEVK
jgi:ATP-dependent Zn protease